MDVLRWSCPCAPLCRGETGCRRGLWGSMLFGKMEDAALTKAVKHHLWNRKCRTGLAVTSLPRLWISRWCTFWDPSISFLSAYPSNHSGGHTYPYKYYCFFNCFIGHILQKAKRQTVVFEKKSPSSKIITFCCFATFAQVFFWAHLILISKSSDRTRRNVLLVVWMLWYVLEKREYELWLLWIARVFPWMCPLRVWIS